MALSGTAVAADNDKASTAAVTNAKFSKLKQRVTALEGRTTTIPVTLPPSGPAGGDLTGNYPSPLLGSNVINAPQLGEAIVERSDATPTLILGGVAGNGAYNSATSTVTCNAGEQLIAGHGAWTDNSADEELIITEIELNHSTETVSVIGASDMGTSPGGDRNLVAQASCLHG